MEEASNYREYLKSDTVKVKKYFYVIRPLLACKRNVFLKWWLT